MAKIWAPTEITKTFSKKFYFYKYLASISRAILVYLFLYNAENVDLYNNIQNHMCMIITIYICGFQITVIFYENNGIACRSADR